MTTRCTSKGARGAAASRPGIFRRPLQVNASVLRAVSERLVSKRWPHVSLASVATSESASLLGEACPQQSPRDSDVGFWISRGNHEGEGVNEIAAITVAQNNGLHQTGARGVAPSYSSEGQSSLGAPAGEAEC